MKHFDKFADWASEKLGEPVVFVIALVLCLLWGLAGPAFHFSDTWQLIANTATTIVTFLMIFLVQSSQNADTEAIQEKLDRLLEEIEDVDGKGLVGKRKERKR
jgi:low affinity Fe/Cu permease